MTLNYRGDPSFKTWTVAEPECHNLCHRLQVDCYLIDAMPVDEWISGGCRPCVTNSIILSQVPNAEKIIRTADTFYGVYYHNYPIPTRINPSKSFNCLMNRMDTIRQACLYQLVRKKIFDQGYISFNLDVTRIPWYQNWNPIEAFQHQFDSMMQIFKEEHEIIKNKMPYRNFHSNADITDVLLDSKITLILETYFDRNDVITYSEKIFRSLQLPRPWLLFSHKHAVKYLRLIGFDVLDDIIDHSQYDNIDFSIERQSQILTLLEKHIDKDLDHERLERAAMTNQTLLKKFSHVWFEDFVKCVEHAAKHH